MAWVLVPRFILSDRLKALGMPVVALQNHLPKDAPREYWEIHPPAIVYRWYAEVIAKRLREERLLPGRGTA